MKTNQSNIDAQKLKDYVHRRAEEILRCFGLEPEPSGDEQLLCICPFCGGGNSKEKSFNYGMRTQGWDCKRTSCSQPPGYGLIDIIAKVDNMSGDFKEWLQPIAEKYRFSTVSFNPSTTTTPPKATPAQKEKDSQKAWDRYSKEGTAPYLEKKKISPPPGALYGKWRNKEEERTIAYDTLFVPFHDIDGNFVTFQSVFKEGRDGKKFYSTVKDSFYSTQSLVGATEVYICEGIATAITIWESLEKKVPVIVVGGQGRFPKVSNLIHKKHPHLKRTIACDMGDKPYLDQIEGEFYWVEPNFKEMHYEGKEKLSDFNDLISKLDQPRDVVAQQLRNVQKYERSMQELELSRPASSSNAKSVNGWMEHFNIRSLKDVPEPPHLFEMPPEYIEKLEVSHSKRVRLIQKGEGVILGGAAKCGKSLFALNAAVAVATGSNLLGVFKPTEIGPVLYLSFEDDITVLLNRLSAFNLDDKQLDRLGCNLKILNGKEPLLSSTCSKQASLTEDGEKIKKLCKEFHPVFIVVDTLSKAFSYDENCNVTANTMHLKGYELFGIERGSDKNPTVLFIQHLRKSAAMQTENLTIESIRGASALTAGCRTVLGFKKEDDGRTLKMLGANCGEDFKALAIDNNIQMKLPLLEDSPPSSSKKAANNNHSGNYNPFKKKK